jgi:small multidrug resistance pump
VNALLLIAGIACNASASILVKFAMAAPRAAPSLVAPWSVLTNLPLMLGVALYGAAFILYAAALARMPLNVVHPVLTSGAIAAVAVASALLFREAFPWTTLVGIMLVLAGVLLITVRIQ